MVVQMTGQNGSNLAGIGFEKFDEGKGFRCGLRMVQPEIVAAGKEDISVAFSHDGNVHGDQQRFAQKKELTQFIGLFRGDLAVGVVDTDQE
jgi:hypothetical protein